MLKKMQIENRFFIIYVHKTRLKYFQFLICFLKLFSIRNIELYFYTQSSQNNFELSHNTNGTSKCALSRPVYTTPLNRFTLQRDVLP